MMSTTEPRYLVDRADSADYEPMIIEGEQVGEAHWLRTEGYHGNPDEACLWRTSAPARDEYVLTGDESFQVLEGSASIELVDTGERVELKTGDITSFAKGTRSIWTFTEPFKRVHRDLGLAPASRLQGSSCGRLGRTISSATALRAVEGGVRGEPGTSIEAV